MEYRMNDLCNDLLAEYDELADLCDSLTDAQWQQASPFYGWAPWDEVAHLAYFDEAATEAITDAQAFQKSAQALMQLMLRGDEISAVARAHYAATPDRRLLPVWRTRYQHLVALLREKDPKDRLPWYGPSMSARSFATARLMETWAHGQDIWDVAGRRRPLTHRLRHIAHLGVTTMGWTYVNRKLPAPTHAVSVLLDAPDGSTWTWGDAAASERVTGPALDFCLVVTQRRHVDDTQLKVQGATAREWLLMAQCFAGPPADGPAPGVRAQPQDRL